MTEHRVIFQSDVQLEGHWDPAPTNRAVVVCHPHPQYGGDMHNPVVTSVTETYKQRGFSTLRFNFRGVGDSTGSYDHGRDEQSDVSAALAYAKAQGAVSLDLVGYSFGAWVNALTPTASLPVRHQVMVSPPVGMIDFSEGGRIPTLGLVVTGDRDTIAPMDQIQRWLPMWHSEAELSVITGADHFYSGRLSELMRAIGSWLDRKTSA